MRIDRLLAIGITLALVFVCASKAHAQRPKRVGVVVTVLVNLTDAEGRKISDELGAALGNEFSVDVISGMETERRLPEGGVPDECVADVACRNDLGRRLDADELLMLVLLRLGDEIQIDTTWAQVASGDTASRPKVVVKPGDERSDVFRQAAPRLLPHVVKPEVEKPRPEIIVVPQQTQPVTQAPIPIQPPPGDKDVPLASWIAGTVSVAALVGGTITALSAREKFQALEDEGCRSMSCGDEAIEDVDRRALAADILFGVSGAAAATALIVYIASSGPESRAQSAQRIELRPGPGSVGLALGGEF